MSLHTITSCNKSRRGGVESKGLHFAAEEDAMTVPLCVVCTGNVRVKEDLKKMGEVVYGGQTHFQFNTIYSWKVRTMKLWTMQKKKVRRSAVHVDTDDLSETDGDDDNDEEMLPIGDIPS